MRDRAFAKQGSTGGAFAAGFLTIEDLVERAANEAATPTPSAGDSEAEALRTRLARAERDARRYKEGLERAVAKLNQTTAELDVARRIVERTRGSTPRRGPRTTIRGKGVRTVPSLVDRDFSVDGPDRLWVAEITCVPTWSGFSFLAVVMDA